MSSHSFSSESFPDCLSRYFAFTETIKEALAVSSPLSPSVKYKDTSVYTHKSLPPTPWWDNECSKWIRLRKAAWLKYKHTKSRVDFIAFKRAEAKSRYELKKKKKEKFISFCESLRKDTNPTYV